MKGMLYGNISFYFCSRILSDTMGKTSTVTKRLKTKIDRRTFTKRFTPNIRGTRKSNILGIGCKWFFIHRLYTIHVYFLFWNSIYEKNVKFRSLETWNFFVFWKVSRIRSFEKFISVDKNIRIRRGRKQKCRIII